MSSDNTDDADFDSVYKTLQIECKEQLIPQVNTIFEEHYVGDELVEFCNTESHDNKANEELIADSIFSITGHGVSNKYHFECQSYEDTSLALRMTKYELRTAMEDMKSNKKIVILTIPKSAVIYLRSGKNTRDDMTVIIRTPKGDIEYPIKVIELSDYTIEEIFEKKLYLLIPFYIFTLEKKFDIIENSKEELSKICEKYKMIMARLDELVIMNEMTEYQKIIIKDMSERVVKRLTKHHKKIQKEVKEAMGGQYIMTEARRQLDMGIQLGISQGLSQGMERINKLIKILVTTGRTDEVERVVDDPEYQKKLLEEFGL